MTTYFVSPPAETAWALEPEVVADRLRVDWPDARVRMVPSGSGRSASIEFGCTVDGEAVSGSLDRAGQALAVEASAGAAATVIVWFRAVVEDGQELLAYDEHFADSVPVPPGTTASDVAAVFAGR